MSSRHIFTQTECLDRAKELRAMAAKESDLRGRKLLIHTAKEYERIAKLLPDFGQQRSRSLSSS